MRAKRTSGRDDENRPAIDAGHQKNKQDRRGYYHIIAIIATQTTHLALTAAVQGRIHAGVDPIQVDGSADALEHLSARRRRAHAGFVSLHRNGFGKC